MGLSGSAIAGIVTALIAAGTSAYAASESAAAQRRNNQFLADQAERDAEQRRLDAAAAAEDLRRQHARTLAQQRARYAASGVSLEEGSPLLVMIDSEEEAALDIARVKHGGRQASTGFLTEARFRQSQGRAAQRSGYLQAGASILGGAAAAYSAYSRGSSSGVKAGGGDGGVNAGVY